MCNEKRFTAKNHVRNTDSHERIEQFSFAIFADPLHPTAVSNGITANMLIIQANMTFDDSIPLYSEDELADMAGLLAAP